MRKARVTTTTNMQIRYGTPADAERLAHFAAQTFTATYRDLDNAKDIADYVAEHFSITAVAAVLCDPACTTLLAEEGATLAGYGVLRQKEPPPCVFGPGSINLWRLYLDTAFIGQGLGARLLAAVHAEAARRRAATLWLGVYERNVRAVQFYEYNGFRKVGDHEFLFGGDTYIDPIYAAPVLVASARESQSACDHASSAHADDPSGSD